MTKNRIVAAIELGSTKIATLIAQVSVDSVSFEKTVNIVGVASSESRGIKKGQIVDIEEAVEATISSVEAAERMAGYNLDNAFISLGGAHVSSQNSHIIRSPASRGILGHVSGKSNQTSLSPLRLTSTEVRRPVKIT